jgi:hypothetical protein
VFLPISIDMALGFDDLEKVFEVTEFLDNRDTLIEEFKPEVQKLIVKKTFFTGPFRRAYEDAFDDLIVKLIRSQLVQHFNYTPEEIILLTDKTFLKIITEDFYFEQDNYVDKNALDA